MTIEGAHIKGTETGSLVFSVDGRTVLTRGGDDTVKRRFSYVLWMSGLTICSFSVGPAVVQKAFGNTFQPGELVLDNKCYLQPRRQACSHRRCRDLEG